jgi:hypothetical protein
MKMEMASQHLVPRMQDAQKPRFTTNIIPAEFKDCFRDCFEQYVKKHFFVAQYQRVQFVRQCKNIMEISYRQQF